MWVEGSDGSVIIRCFPFLSELFSLWYTGILPL